MKNIICPHCDSEDIFYIKTRIYGSAETYFNADGSYAMEGENSALHDSLDYKYGKILYCGNCNKGVGRVEDIKKEIELEILDY